MTLDELLRVFDAAEANLTKLEAIWEQAEPMLPDSPSTGTKRQYETLRRSWTLIAQALPPIDTWSMIAELPDADEMGRSFLDYSEAGIPTFSLLNQREQPGVDLDEYRFRLSTARKRAITERLAELTAAVDNALPHIIRDVPRDSTQILRGEKCEVVTESVAEIDRLVGSALERPGRWSDLRRHLSFSEGHDWHDISDHDWPDVRAGVRRALLSEWDPVPTADIDLGAASKQSPTGGVAARINWATLSDEDFERLLYNLLLKLDGYQNVRWLMKTNAPDRSRDISVERVLHDSSGEVRTERVMIQAKHWQSKSVAAKDVTDCLAPISAWEPPTVHCVVIATSGRFSADAVTVVERRIDANTQPRVEMWADSRLEQLLSQRPDLIAEFGLSSTP